MEEKKTLINRSTGQIVIEYVLLVAVTVVTASIISTALVKRNSTNPDRQGFIIKIWSKILDTIGADTPEN